MKDTAKTVERVLRIAMLVVVFCGYAALITTDTFPPVLLAIPVVLILLMPLGEWLDQRYRLYKRFFLFLTLALLISIPFLFLFMDLLQVVISLIMYIQVFSMLQRKTPMSYRHLLMMAFFLVIAACVLSPDPTIGFVMAVFLVASMVALAALQLHVELGQPETQLADVETSGEDQTAYGTPGRPATWGVTAAGVLVSLAALSLTGFLFAATPRMEAGLLGRADTTVFRTQLNDAVNLSQGGYISLDQTPVMRVRFPDEPSGQYNGNLFWRTSTLCQYGAGNWERNGISPLADQPAFALSSKAALPGLLAGGMAAIRRAPWENRRTVRSIAYINDVPAEGVPLLTLVKDVRVEGASGSSVLTWDPNADFTVIFKKRGARWLEYDAVSEVEEFTPDQLRKAPDNYGEVLSFRDYRVLTYQHLSPETLRTVERVTNGKATVYDKVFALMRYLAGNRFMYSRNLPQLPQDDPIDAFLNATRLGHCELFASALSLMLRSQGIPTRVVSGYRGGEWSGGDQSYVVSAE